MVALKDDAMVHWLVEKWAVLKVDLTDNMLVAWLVDEMDTMMAAQRADQMDDTTVACSAELKVGC